MSGYFKTARPPSREVSSPDMTKGVQHQQRKNEDTIPTPPDERMAGWTLHSRPLRRCLVTVLCLIFLWNSFLVISSTGMALAIYGIREATSHHLNSGSGQNGARLVLLLCRLLIPIGLWMNSINDLYSLWLRTPTPLRMVVTAASSFVLLIVAIGYWAPCMPAAVLTRPANLEVPFVDPTASSAFHVDSSLKKYNCDAIPWLVTPGLLLYIAYLSLGAIVLYHERKLE